MDQKKNWPKRALLNSENKNIIKETLVDPLKILLPPLHIKLGITKQFLKVLSKDGPSFMYIWDKFKYLSDAKIKEGIFVEPEIRKLIHDEKF